VHNADSGKAENGAAGATVETVFRIGFANDALRVTDRAAGAETSKFKHQTPEKSHIGSEESV